MSSYGSDLYVSFYACRANLGLSQEEFGKLLNPPVSKQTISSWESGKTTPTTERIINIAQVSKIPVDLIINFLMKKKGV